MDAGRGVDVDSRVAFAGFLLLLALGFILGSNNPVPGGVDGAVQFNQDGTFGGSGDWLHFDYVNGRLGILTTDPQSRLQVGVPDNGVYEYIQIGADNQTPPADDCDNESEVGRLYVGDEVGNGRLFVCSTPPDGWISTPLS